MDFNFDEREYKGMIETVYLKALGKMFIAIILTGIIGIKTEILYSFIPGINLGGSTVIAILIGLGIAFIININTKIKIEEMKMNLEIYKSIIERN